MSLDHLAEAVEMPDLREKICRFLWYQYYPDGEAGDDVHLFRSPFLQPQRFRLCLRQLRHHGRSPRPRRGWGKYEDCGGCLSNLLELARCRGDAGV